MSEAREPTVTASIQEWQTACHQLSKSKGWWDEKTPAQLEAEKKLAVIALMHRRYSCELEDIRKGDRSTVLDEQTFREGAKREVEKLTPLQIEMLAKVALVHSELSEAVECIATYDFRMHEGEGGKPEGFVVELADAVIRIFDSCGRYGLRLAEAVWFKHAYNARRTHRHGGKLA